MVPSWVLISRERCTDTFVKLRLAIEGRNFRQTFRAPAVTLGVPYRVDQPCYPVGKLRVKTCAYTSMTRQLVGALRRGPPKCGETSYRALDGTYCTWRAHTEHGRFAFLQEVSLCFVWAAYHCLTAVLHEGGRTRLLWLYCGAAAKVYPNNFSILESIVQLSKAHTAAVVCGLHQ